jgi:colanic acid/amylovoran biosynthesis glycosyltransferase
MNKKKLKVAFHVGELPATTFINRLAEGLAKSDIEVTLYGLIKKKFKAPRNVRISGTKDGWKEGRSGKFIAFLTYSVLLFLFNPTKKKNIDRWLKQNAYLHWGIKSWIYPIVWDAPDIIHVQWAKAIKQFEWASALNIKLVLSLRGAHINYSPLSVAGLAESYQKVFPKIDAFHGVSHAICHEAAKYGADITRCRVVYSGFDLTQFPKSDWQNDFETLKHRPIKIISVGRTHWKKGYHFALDAMRMLKDRNVSFEYTIIGAAGSEELLFQRNQLDLEDCVTFLDKVPFLSVKQYIRHADVLLLPSVEEGIANVVVEAMLLGTLVVSTNCGGMIEVVKDEITGLIVETRDSMAICNAIDSIKSLSPITLSKMTEDAFVLVSHQNSEDAMIKGMTAVYNLAKTEKL